MKRHYCTYCNKKRNEDKMKEVWYSLLKKSFWHCLDCLSDATDIFYSSKIVKTKCIQITTIENNGFAEMSGMVSEIEKVISGYPSNYKIKYYFK